MKEQKLVVFDGDSSKVNMGVELYIKDGWRVVKFESRVPVYEDYNGSAGNNIILTVLFER